MLGSSARLMPQVLLLLCSFFDLCVDAHNAMQLTEPVNVDSWCLHVGLT